MINQITDLMSQGDLLVKAGAALTVLVVTVITYARQRALVPTVSAVLVGGFLLWAINNMTSVEDKFDSDLGPGGTEEDGAPALVLNVDTTTGGFGTGF